MTHDEVLAIVSIAVTLMLGALAIILSVWFFRQSQQGEKEASNVLLQVKSTAEAVKHEVRDIVAPLFHSVMHKGEVEGWKSEMCCSNDDVIQLERSVRLGGKIYVSVVTMNYEVDKFINVIAENLNQGKQYFYFLPTDMPGGYQGEMQKLVDALTEKPSLTLDTLEKNLRIYKVETGEILCNVTLFDPTHGVDLGFILPAYDHADRAFSVKLDNTLYNRAWTRVQGWLEGSGGAKIIWPKPATSS